eukprot:SAG31_NODE_36255_length_315_cov_0.712963_1_plen_62_part_10
MIQLRGKLRQPDLNVYGHGCGGDSAVVVVSIQEEIVRFAGYRRIWVLTFDDQLKSKRGSKKN